MKQHQKHCEKMVVDREKKILNEVKTIENVNRIPQCFQRNSQVSKGYPFFKKMTWKLERTSLYFP